MTDQKPVQPCLPTCRFVAVGYSTEEFVHDLKCDRHQVNVARNAPGYIAPVSVPPKYVDLGMGVPVEIKPAPAEAPKVERLCVCGHAKREHAMYEDHEECQACEDRDCDRYRPAPRRAPKVVEYDPNCGACKMAALTGKRPQHIHFSDNLKSAPAPASVPPASDQEVAQLRVELGNLWTWGSSPELAVHRCHYMDLVRAAHKCFARIEAEKVTNAELREDIEALHLMAQGVKHYWQCREGDCLRCQAESLRARLAEVSEKATELVTAWDAGWALKSELEAILAKGDK